MTGRVLVACEFSGTVRDAFIALGVDAMSCDLLPTDRPGPHHQGDVRDVLGDGWDLMIAHPPCTYLTNSANGSLYRETSPSGALVGPDRWKALIEGAVFFRDLLDADVPRVAVENPVMNGYAAKIVGRRHNQLVQPFMFGHLESKGAALWLRNLPLLRPTHDRRDEAMALPAKERDRAHWRPPGADRWKWRSITYPGIAQAMAEQWSPLLAVPETSSQENAA